ncbi:MULTISPECIES: sulfonate ABC transporter substrate-binding protein [Hyphomicrobiales]|jgi:aliphatic sulfonates family ABC transporter substrate-binding protein|uniref:sulfonate ABC transporter substrate-binding protein n=1 Tax=Methylobacterium sp. CCH7-A2 TaxID=1768789 RepID=UPI00082E1E6F|nr:MULTISPECIES: sulfonate ABC transporter substrate-binding protein [Hyphomicrobiales]
MDRRDFIAGLAGSALASGAALAQPAAPLKELRIGFQKNGILLIAKQQGVLEKRFAAQGIGIKWVEFQFGPPLLEALNVASIDYGPTGDAPPIFAQAARANLLYVATQEAAGSGAAILLPPNSPIRTLTDLKGKKIAFAKASSSHNLTIAAIEKAGIGYEEFTPVYLPPADARAAFERGSVDAWTIWDPFFAIAEQVPGVRILSLSKGIVAQNSFYLANRDFTGRHPDVVAAINDELAKVARWAETHRGEVAAVQAAATGLPIEPWKRAVDRADFVIAPLNPRVLDEQQRVADRFHRLGLIPKPINVRDIVWDWKPTA